MFFKKKKEKIIYNVEKMTKDAAGTRLDVGDIIILIKNFNETPKFYYAIIDNIEKDMLEVRIFKRRTEDVIVILTKINAKDVLKTVPIQIPLSLRQLFINEINRKNNE